MPNQQTRTETIAIDFIVRVGEEPTRRRDDELVVAGKLEVGLPACAPIATRALG